MLKGRARSTAGPTSLQIFSIFCLNTSNSYNKVCEREKPGLGEGDDNISSVGQEAWVVFWLKVPVSCFIEAVLND